MLNLEKHDLFRFQGSLTIDKNPSLFDRVKETFASFEHVLEKGLDQWLITFSGGKDSTLTLLLALEYALKHPGRLKRLDVLYSDTRMEIPTIHKFAKDFLTHVKSDGRFSTLPIVIHTVYPLMKDRFWVKVLGDGYPPPHQKFRWCTDRLKIRPAEKRLKKFLVPGKTAVLTGVRFGESNSRDQRLNLSCTRGGECGQGLWFQQSSKLNVGYLAPIVNWPLCDVWDFLAGFAPELGYPTRNLKSIYNGHDTRFGCWTCTVVRQDKAMLRTIEQEQWAHLRPLYEFRSHLWNSTRDPLTRVVKPNGMVGKIKVTERKKLLNQLLQIQQQTGVHLITEAETSYIRNIWKKK